METLLQKGDIINISGKGFFSWIVKIFTGSRFSHTACYVGEENIIESIASGVQLSHISKYKDVDWVILRHKKGSAKQKSQAVEWMITQLGAKYDYGGIFGIGLHILGFRDRNSWDDNTRYWCSELVSDGYINSGMELDVNEDTFKVSPGDLYNDSNLITIPV